MVLRCGALAIVALVVPLAVLTGFDGTGAALSKAVFAALPLAADLRGAAGATLGAGAAAGGPASTLSTSTMSRPNSAARSSPASVFSAPGPFRAPGNAAPRSASSA